MLVTFNVELQIKNCLWTSISKNFDIEVPERLWFRYRSLKLRYLWNYDIGVASQARIQYHPDVATLARGSNNWKHSLFCCHNHSLRVRLGPILLASEFFQIKHKNDLVGHSHCDVHIYAPGIACPGIACPATGSILYTLCGRGPPRQTRSRSLAGGCLFKCFNLFF